MSNSLKQAIDFLDELFDSKVLPQLKPCFTEYVETSIEGSQVLIYMFDLDKIPDTYSGPLLLKSLKDGFLIELHTIGDPVPTFTYIGDLLYIIQIIT